MGGGRWSRVSGLADRFVRDPETGRLAIFQAPNLPLLVWLGATVIDAVVEADGRFGWILSTTGTVALVWWAIDEVWRGDSPFRRCLGAVVLGAVVGSRLL